MEQPASYLSIEECMDEEMFFMAPSGSDTEDTSKDSDSEDMFLSAHDDLSLLATELEPHTEPAGQGTAPEPPAAAEPGTTGTAMLQDGFSMPEAAGQCSMEEEDGGDGEHLGGLGGESAEQGAQGAGKPPEEEGQGGGSKDKALDGSAGPSRTDSSTESSPGDEAGQALGCTEAGLLPSELDGDVEEDGAGCDPPVAEELETGKAQSQPSQGSPPVALLETTPQEPQSLLVPELLPRSAAHAEGTIPEGIPDASPLSASAPELRDALPEVPVRGCAEPAPRPESMAVLRRDGSAAVRLASRTIRVQQAKSVPVVPPKPQFAKIPPALKPAPLPAAGAPWARAGADSEGWGATLPRRPPGSAVPESPRGVTLEKRHSSSGCLDGSGAGGQAARRAAWRNSGSMSFDTAVALATERHLAQMPVRRIQTYSGEEMPEPPGTAKPLPFHKAPLKPLGQRLLRPHSCVVAPEGLALGKAPQAPAGPTLPTEAPGSAICQLEPPARDRLSLPRAETEETGATLQGAREVESPGGAGEG